MSKRNRAKANNNLAAGLLCGLIYGGIIGYYYGCGQTEQKARVQAKELRANQRLTELEIAIGQMQMKLKEASNATS